ncbi:MAG: hypothetical protein U1E56_02215 [Bauldia sp.]
MAITVDIYKGANKLGSGTANNQSTAITGYAANLGRPVGTGRNVTLVATSGANIGAAWRSRVVNDGGTTLTLATPCPYA